MSAARSKIRSLRISAAPISALPKVYVQRLADAEHDGRVKSVSGKTSSISWLPLAQNAAGYL